MHYMPGTQVHLSAQVDIQSAGGPRPLNAPQPLKKRAPKNPYFEPGITYTLSTLRQESDGKMLYIFLREDNQQEHHVVFPDVRTAETVIASARNESLPDYDSFHRRWNG